MAETTRRSSSKSRSSRSSSNGGSGNASTPNRRSSGSSASRSRSSRSSSASSRQNASAISAQQRNGGGGVAGTIKNLAVPAVTAAAGIVGGVVLERRHKRPRKVLGVPIPGTGSGMNGLTKEVRKAGKQFGKLASEVQTTRKKAEDIGNALS